MASAFPQIVRCTLGQGGGPVWLDEQAAVAYHAIRLFGRESAQARACLPVVLEPEPPRSTLAAWALNLPVVKDLAEPTREEL